SDSDMYLTQKTIHSGAVGKQVEEYEDCCDELEVPESAVKELARSQHPPLDKTIRSGAVGKQVEQYEGCCDELKVPESAVKELARSQHPPLDKYLHQCAKSEVKAQILVLEEFDIAEGIRELVDKFWIRTLVMGAASDKHYSKCVAKNMKVPQSKKAIKLMENAHPFCEIWFVCSRKLIFTSNMNDLKSVSVFVDADEGLRDVNSFEKDHSQVVSGQADVAQNLVEMYKQRDPEMLEGELPDAGNRVKESHETPIDMMTPAQASAVRVVEILHQQNQEVTNKWSNTSKEVAEQLEQNKQLTIERDTALTKIRLLENQKKQMVAEWNFSMKQIVELRKQKRQVTTERDNALEELEIFRKQQGKTKDKKIQNETEWMMIESNCANGDIVQLQKQKRHATAKLDNVMVEMEIFRKKAEQGKTEVKELNKEKDRMMAKLNSAFTLVLEQRRKKDLITGKAHVAREIEVLRREKHGIVTELDNVVKELMEARKQKALMTSERDHISEVAKELKSQLEQIMSERDNAVRRIEKLQEPELQGSQFTSAELRRATQDFNDRFKIGQGGSAVVYKGFLRNTTVAIKMLNPDSSSRGQSEFKQEVTILSRVRHPNVVNFVGACPEVQTIVYEFMPNGSLEDRLEGKAGTPPLPWQARARIITEICSALSFMHKNKPNAIVHGDIKPANILLDHNLVSKLSDFGMSRLLTQSSTTGNGGIYCTSHPWGTLGYMDPEFQTTGELTLQTDTYSFGVTILRVLTAKSPFNLLRVVQNALERGDLSSVMDTSAGEWPITLAMQLASLALRCTDRTRDMRPDMAGEVWSVVKRLADEAAEEASVGSRKHGCCSSVPLNRQQVSIAYHSKCFSGIKIQSVAEAFRR
ncbi:hypothetical protein EJB05_51216, partial [Eragrostis curvula]